MNTTHASGKPRASSRGVAVAVLLAVAAAGITALERNAAHATHPVPVAVPVAAPATAADPSRPVASDVFKSGNTLDVEELPPTF